MREELDQFMGAAWGESSPKRKGYRNGTYTRDLVTSTGRLQDLQVPRDRCAGYLGYPFQKRALLMALPVLFLGNLRIR